MDRFKKRLAALVGMAMGVPPDEVEKLIGAPKERAHGDLAIPCFKLKQLLGRNDKGEEVKLAREIAERTPVGDLIAKIVPVGPFVNFTLAPAGVAKDILVECFLAERPGAADEGRGRTVVLDYSSPNIAKPFHLGHLRSTVIGHSLRRLHELLGWRVWGVNHLGDWGTQFGFMLAAWSRWKDEALARIAGGAGEIDVFVELYVRINALAKEDPKVRDEARAWFKRLEDGDQDARKLWNYFVERSKREFERIYEILGIRHDSDAGESFYNDKMQTVLDLVRERGLLVKGERPERDDDDDLAGERATDARPWGIDLGDPKEGGLGFTILLKSDGGTTYLTRDLAAVFYRRREFDPAKIIYVVGAPQILHFKQLRAILAKLDPALAELVVHVPFGQYLGMSTRKGTAVFLDEVLRRARDVALEAALDAKKKADLSPEEIAANARKIGAGAVRFFDLKGGRTKDIDLSAKEGADGVDLDRLLAAKGETGPYVQYTYARLSGILRKLGREPTADVDFARLGEPEAVALAKAIAELPGRIRAAKDELEPSIIARYLLDLASAANAFVHVHRVIDAEPAVRDARALLVLCARKAVGQCLDVLGIEPLERM